MAFKNYYTMNGQIIGESGPEGTVDYQLDGLWSVIGTWRTTGSLQNQYRYSGYGQLVHKSGTGADPYFQWMGGWGYRTRGMVYVRRRTFYEDAAAWTSVDPLWPDESAYRYCLENPASYIDPKSTQGTIPQPTRTPPKGWDDWDLGDSLPSPAPSEDPGPTGLDVALMFVRKVGKVGGVVGLAFWPTPCGGGQGLWPFDPPDISPSPVKNPWPDARCEALHDRYHAVCDRPLRCKGQAKGETDEHFCNRIKGSVHSGQDCTTLRRLYLANCNPTPKNNETPEQARCRLMRALCDHYGNVARCMKIGAKCAPHADELPRWPDLGVVRGQCRAWQKACGEKFNWPPKR